MAVQTKVIETTNLSDAWTEAFLTLMQRGVTELSPLVVKVGFQEEVERPEIRQALDTTLCEAGLKSCHTVANTLFPSRMWDAEKPRNELYDRYSKAFARIRQRGNPYGTYFGRLVAFPTPEGPFNQLEHIIETYGRGNHRRSALQASIFDPRRDHTHQRRRGFPCLQQVAFAPVGTQHLSLMAVYTVQYLVDKAYGNYLGLYRLGRFMAHEMGLHLVEMTCVAGTAQLGNVSKERLRQLAGTVQPLLAAPAAAV